MPLDIGQFVGDDGNFTPEFKGAALAELGEGYKDNNVLDTIKNPAGLVKAFLDTKADVGKKLEGVIQKPAENAPEQEKAEYRKSLQAALGAPKTKEEYEFPRPENMPEGISYDEEMEGHFRELFFEEGVSIETVKKLAGKLNEVQMARVTVQLEAQQKELTEAGTQLDKDWTGDARIKNNRTAFKAIMKFADEDLTKLLKDAKINDNANIVDHQKWSDCGFSPAQRRLWLNIGSATKVDEAITDEGLPAEAPGAGKKSVLGKIYDHPTSQKMVETSKV